MPTVFDLECYLPPDESGKSRRLPAKRATAGPQGPDRSPERPNYGFANYDRIFTRRAEQGIAAAGEGAKLQRIRRVRGGPEGGHPPGHAVDSPNTVMAEAVRSFPDRFVALALLSPQCLGNQAVKELSADFGEDGFRGVFVSPLRSEIPASDRRYYPLYTKCAERRDRPHLLLDELCQ